MTDVLIKRREVAQERMVAAKSRFTRAVEAVLAGDASAPTLCRIALDQLSEARDELRRLGAMEPR